MSSPKIICLCGSTKFKEEFEKTALEETLKGNIILTVAAFGHADNITFTREQKSLLDALHMHKILLADEIIVIAPGRYIGESTEREIEFAKLNGKRIEIRTKF